MDIEAAKMLGSGIAVVGVIASVVGAFYYLRIIKIMYFDEPEETLERSTSREINLIVSGTGVLTLFFFVFPAPLLAWAKAAAAALLP